MDPALFRTIALETNDQGQADAQLALAARRVIDRDGAVVFNPDDPGVPMWKKFAIPFALIAAGDMEPDNLAYFRVPVTPLKPFTTVHAAIMKPTASFEGGTEGNPIDTLQTMLGVSIPGSNVYPTAFLDFDVGYSDPDIANDSTYIIRNHGELFPAAGGMFNAWQEPRQVNVYLKFSSNLGVLADYQTITAGGLEIWLLVSKLPDAPW